MDKYFIIHETRMGRELERINIKGQDNLKKALVRYINNLGYLSDGDIFKIVEKITPD